MKEGVAHAVKRRHIIIGAYKRRVTRSVKDELILQRVDGSDIVRIVWIDENARCQANELRVEFVECQLVGSSFMVDAVDEVILIDHHHREVAISRIGQRHRRRLAEVDDDRTVERVAILPDDRLVVERRDCPRVRPNAGVAAERTEHSIRFCSCEVGNVDVFARHRDPLFYVTCR